MIGVVREFERSYGFIEAEDKMADVFVHYMDIADPEPNGFRILYSGDVVEFDLENTSKGSKAKNVRIIERNR